MKKTATLLIDFAEIVLICTAVVLIMYLFVGQIMVVSQNSMFPTFHDGEYIIAEKATVRTKPLFRGDIVIFSHPENKSNVLIKRLIALPGDRVRLSNGVVYVNGTVLEEPYLSESVVTESDFALKEDVEYFVKDGSYIVMGDNRQESIDSRHWGSISNKDLIGKPILVFYPLNKIRLVKS